MITYLLRLRRRNDQQMLLERIFLLAQGLPGQHSYRHALFSPAKFNSYGKLRWWDAGIKHF